MNRFFRDAATKLSGIVVDECRTNVFQSLTALPEAATSSGYTVRRSVKRVGRNEPCPCGSGKKYKRCCYATDQQRLRRSSDISGVTVDELRANPEQYLTVERLHRMQSFELARLNPRHVSQELLPVLINKLLLFDEHEAVAAIFEAVGLDDGLKGYWDDAMHMAAARANKAVVERLLAVHPGLEPEEYAAFGLAVRLLTSVDEGEQLRLIEAEALDCLRREGPIRYFDIAYDLLNSQYPALGILTARGALPLVGDLDAEMLLDTLLDTRDRLDLLSEEPVESAMEERFRDAWSSTPESADNHDFEQLAELRGDLEEQSRETRRLRQEIAALQQRLEAAQVVAQAPTPTPNTNEGGIGSTDQALKAVRQKLGSLRQELKDRHRERNQLRKELAETRSAIGSMTKVTDTGGEDDRPSEDDKEEAFLADTEEPSLAPVRVPTFPRKFNAVLGAVPEHIARAALQLIGRLAAGDLTAYRGVKGLKRRKGVYSQRVGAAHRLLFELDHENLVVVALINRRDLERTIRAL